MNEETFYWHDYETTGSDVARDRPLQFAGLRTDAALQPLGEPELFYCQPAADVLPHPDACLLTGISPQQAQRMGVAEPEFAARVHERLAQPGTCGVGWNSLRFDDEITRYLLYRNFHDPYAREWQHGNSRWDLIDLARMAYALRPQGMQWPRRDDGAPSFRLEHLAAANDCSAGRAHDAREDVLALLALARKLRAAQPRLWDWYYALRRKARVAALIDLGAMTPLLHVSQRYPAQRGCLAMVLPLSQHPLQANKVIVADLAPDPSAWMDLDADALAERLYTARDDLPADIARVPLKTISLNKAPALAPLDTLAGVDTARIGLDVPACLEHAATLRACSGLAERVRTLYAQQPRAPQADAELALYDGFLPDRDRALLAQVRSAPPAALRALQERFTDARYRTLLLHWRARHQPQTLDADEAAQWQALLQRRLGAHEGWLGFAPYFARIAELRALPGRSGNDLALLDQLEDWGRQRAVEIGWSPHDV